MSADLVLLHGWGLHGGVWGEFGRLLAERRAVMAPDLPGFGGSGWPKAANLSGADALNDLVDQLLPTLPEKCSLLGWSLGGMVATRLALRLAQQGRVERLVLMASSPCFAQRPDWPDAMAQATLAAFTEAVAADPAAGLQRFVALQAQGDADARAQVRALRASLNARPQAAAEVLAAGLRILSEVDLRADLLTLAQSGLPVSLIYGEQDSLVPATAARALAQMLPMADFHLLPGRGHALFLTEPARVVELLLDGCHV